MELKAVVPAEIPPAAVALAADLRGLAAKKRKSAGIYRDSAEGQLFTSWANEAEAAAAVMDAAAEVVASPATLARALRLAVAALELNVSVSSGKGGEARRALREIAMAEARRFLEGEG